MIQGVSPSSIFLTRRNQLEYHTLGWTSCDCKAKFHPALVLDPFAGAGTTLLVAHKMGYDWLGIELVQKYVDIANNRIEQHGKVRLDKFQ